MIIFLCIAIAGFIILLFSALFGSDHEIEHDFGLEHDIDHGAEQGSDGGPSVFSIRVICMFLIGIGGGGALARYYGLSYSTSSFIGVGGGILLGLIGWQLMKILWSQQASSTLSENDFLDKTGVVNTAIPSSGIGEISVNVNRKQVHLPARSKDGSAIEEGAEIKIVSHGGSTATVEKIIKTF